jgi:glycosyl transferase family 87
MPDRAPHSIHWLGSRSASRVRDAGLSSTMVLEDLTRLSKFGLPVALLLAGSMWFYMQHVLIGYQMSYAAAHDIPRGNLSDLYPRWLGARELLLHHRDPYSFEVTREIQTGYYGRALDSVRPYDPTDWQGFAYPVYVVFILAPTIALPFPVVQAGFRWLLIALTAASVPLWLRTFRWRASAWTTATLIILVLGSFQAIQGIKLQQLSLLVTGLITFCALLLVEDHLCAAGVLLALATIKPQLVLPLAAWLLFWAVSDWRTRKGLVWGFAGTMAVLIAGGEVVLPGWIGRFRQAVIAYRRYNNGAGSALDLVFTPTWGKVLTVLVVLGLAVVCWRFRRVSNHEPAFHWMMALILTATIVIAPKEAPYNQVLLLPPILLVIRHAQLLWSKSLLSRVSLAIATLIVFWPWLAALGITVAWLFSSADTLQRAWTLPLYTSLAIPLAVFALMAYLFKELWQAEMKAASSRV